MNERSLCTWVGEHQGLPAIKAGASPPLVFRTGSKRLSGCVPNGNHNSSALLQEDPQAGTAGPAARLQVSPAAPRPGVGVAGAARKGSAGSHRSRAGRKENNGLIQWSGAAREGERPGGECDSSRGWGRARRREETEVAAAAAAL
ncbi:unnamed protein product [Rangifer tarandus platyrhynchus]|uniref:Uncharacterized protein n=1 Tax=Rangifer tarandus platyrhynchus TaxID=3082113 RepID=A0AC59YDH7_RANTA